VTRRPTLVLFWILALHGCAATNPAPEDRYYRLPPPHPSVRAGPLVSGAVSVQRFQSSGLHGQRPIVYSDDSSEIELLQYHYHYWIDSPTRLVADFLADYLRAAGAAEPVLVDDGDAGELNISGRITGFERITGSNGGVVVSLQFRVDRRGATAPLLLRDYREEAGVAGDTMERAAAAFGTALDAICARLVRDLETALAQ